MFEGVVLVRIDFHINFKLSYGMGSKVSVYHLKTRPLRCVVNLTWKTFQ